MAAARATLQEIVGTLSLASMDVKAAEVALEQAPAPPADIPMPPDLSDKEKAVTDAQEAAMTAHGALAVAEAACAAAADAWDRIAAMDVERLALEVTLARWNRLAADLGAKGLQAHEIDSACPTLTADTNAILAKGWGSRYVVEFASTRPYADNREGVQEVIDINVVDSGDETTPGWAGDALALSGGQRVPVGMAVRLAFLLMANRRAGIEKPQVLLDEAGPALDTIGGANIRLVTMLRAAAEMLDASMIVLVTHDQAVADLMDVRLLVANGTVTVESV
jgi:DNA repair exonuclease SbcCD ATPase subunit